MSQFTAGFKTMERRRDTEGQLFCDSENLLQSEPSSPEIWEMSSIRANGSLPGQSNGKPPGYLDNGKLQFTTSAPQDEGVPIECEDVEVVSSKPEFPDWRRSAVLTVFIFPPTGLLAMILACMSHSSAQKGDLVLAKRLNCCSCWMVFISLLASLIFIMVCILLRVYGYVEDPF